MAGSGSLLAAIMDKTDGDEISDAEVIQGIRNALLLLGNACQQHSLQRKKAILQHLNPQLKSLVQDADFADAPPYLFGAKFGEFAKERLEAATLIQKAQVKPQIFRSTTPKSSIPGAVGVAAGYSTEAPRQCHVSQRYHFLRVLFNTFRCS